MIGFWGKSLILNLGTAFLETSFTKTVISNLISKNPWGPRTPPAPPPGVRGASVGVVWGLGDDYRGCYDPVF